MRKSAVLLAFVAMLLIAAFSQADDLKKIRDIAATFDPRVFYAILICLLALCIYMGIESLREFRLLSKPLKQAEKQNTFYSRIQAEEALKQNDYSSAMENTSGHEPNTITRAEQALEQEGYDPYSKWYLTREEKGPFTLDFIRAVIIEDKSYPPDVSIRAAKGDGDTWHEAKDILKQIRDDSPTIPATDTSTKNDIHWLLQNFSLQQFAHNYPSPQRESKPRRTQEDELHLSNWIAGCAVVVIMVEREVLQQPMNIVFR